MIRLHCRRLMKPATVIVSEADRQLTDVTVVRARTLEAGPRQEFFRAQLPSRRRFNERMLVRATILSSLLRVMAECPGLAWPRQ